MKFYGFVAGLLLLAGCSGNNKVQVEVLKSDPGLDEIIGPAFKAEVIAEGYVWSEGPVWSEELGGLLFSDVPENSIYLWKPETGAKLYLNPSGFTGTQHSGEKGSNGLILFNNSLILAQHGDRRIARMDAPLDAPASKFTTIAGTWNGKKFNSPNDVFVTPDAKYYFTDPPYGLPEQEKDKTREISFQGVYSAKDTTVTLLVDSLTRPNGIAMMADGKTILVANSDPAKAIWYAIETTPADSVTGVSVFYDATSEVPKGKGLPDGLKIDRKGNVYATGPGGIWIFNSTGKVLGRISISEASSNCALADNDQTLYVTSDAYVLKIKLR